MLQEPYLFTLFVNIQSGIQSSKACIRESVYLSLFYLGYARRARANHHSLADSASIDFAPRGVWIFLPQAVGSFQEGVTEKVVLAGQVDRDNLTTMGWFQQRFELLFINGFAHLRGMLAAGRWINL